MYILHLTYTQGPTAPFRPLSIVGLLHNIKLISFAKTVATVEANAKAKAITANNTCNSLCCIKGVNIKSGCRRVINIAVKS